SVRALRKLIEWGEASADLTVRSRALYDSLVKPAEKLIAASDRLLILPDGPLYTLPWPALARSVKNGRPDYLVEGKPTPPPPPSTVFGELKKERRSPAAPAIDVAAFGDPKYPKLPDKKVAVRRGEDEAAAAEGSTETEDEAVGDAQLDSVVRGGF